MEFYQTFSAEQFKAEMTTLLEVWQDTWYRERGGSVSLSGPSSDPLPEEVSALRMLVEYLATSLVVAVQYEETTLVLSRLVVCFQGVLGGSQWNDVYIKLLTQVFDRTLELVRQKVNTGLLGDIKGLIELQRGRMWKTLGFGYVKSGVKTVEGEGFENREG